MAGHVSPPLRAGNVVRQLSTALWDQSTPFNDDCPLYNGSRTPTGCIPTAASIVLFYNCWPDCGLGEVPAYTTRRYGIYVPSRTLRPYNYDRMLQRYDQGYSQEQAAEMARLIADVGAMCGVDYGLDGTGGSGPPELRALTSYMRYSKRAWFAYRIHYTQEEWHAMMRREVDAGRPVIYGGGNGQFGHQFVLDGYTDNDLFHFNWGWDGQNNGWFYIGGEGFEYKFNQDAIIDLVKDPDGTTTYVSNLMLLAYTTDQGIEFRGVSTTETDIRQNRTFSVRVGGIYNVGTTFSGSFKLAVYDRNGVHKEDISDISTMNGFETGVIWLPSAMSCKIEKRIASGDRIRAVFKAENESEWKLLRRYNEETQDEIPLYPESVDAQKIAAETQFVYDRTARTILITTYEGACVTLTSPSGRKVFEKSTDSGELSADASSLDKGTYTLSISVPDSEVFAFRVVL